jgi:hypothetical protein
MPRLLATSGIVLPSLTLTFVYTILSCRLARLEAHLSHSGFCCWVLEVVLPCFARAAKPIHPNLPALRIHIVNIPLWIFCLVVCILDCEGLGWHKRSLFYSAGTLAHWPCICSFLPYLACQYPGVGALSSANNIGTRLFLALITKIRRPIVLLCEHQLLICGYKSPEVGRLWFWYSSKVQHSNLKFLLYCKPKRQNKANRWELVLAKVLHSIQ